VPLLLSCFAFVLGYNAAAYYSDIAPCVQWHVIDAGWTSSYDSVRWAKKTTNPL
jgi:hypothetical protein